MKPLKMIQFVIASTVIATTMAGSVAEAGARKAHSAKERPPIVIEAGKPAAVPAEGTVSVKFSLTPETDCELLEVTFRGTAGIAALHSADPQAVECVKGKTIEVVADFKVASRANGFGIIDLKLTRGGTVQATSRSVAIRAANASASNLKLTPPEVGPDGEPIVILKARESKR